MNETITIQGRALQPPDIAFINTLIRQNPDWHRTKLSKELCYAWDWKTPYGQIKDMACRTMLLKLDQRGLITLPPSRNKRRKCQSPRKATRVFIPYDTIPVQGTLSSVTPLQVAVVREKHDRNVIRAYMEHHHYLGLRTIVGENLLYTISSRDGVPLAVMIFGAAAWKTAPRDSYIGWSAEKRKTNLFLIANNHRFLLLPWVRIRYLASHILSIIAKRLSDDWQAKYGHPIVLLETFVQRDRFAGTCYRAVGWQYSG